ncbi:hypothetical protein CRM22_007982 [Opisthorchis felineus]|uniref:Protein kinase domain-containing protein n=1 Tax=Opisthorchis felineus TaxID=147828 RepID=A0A4S2LLJ6_OPIFE|nr:hypothetical protein CRM22_007982 [Opisthorchis felineus]
MQVSSGVSVIPVRRKHHSVGRSRSWRAEKRAKCSSGLKLGTGAMDESGVRKPCSKSATNSPKRAISPEVRNWQVRRGFPLPTVEMNLQILRCPRSDESTTDCLPSSVSTPTTWGRSSVDERFTPTGYFNLNSPPDEFPVSPNSSSGYGSKAPSMGVRTPILSSSRKVVQTAAGVPDTLTQPQKPESLFSGIRAAFTRWMDNIRSKNPNTALKNRPLTEPAGKSKSNDDSRRTTLSQSYPTRDLASRRAPNVPAPLKIATSPVCARTTPQKEVYGEAPNELTTSQHCMDTMVGTGWSSFATEEVEKLAKAVTAATTREAQIEAAEKQRREAAARTAAKLVSCDQSWNLYPTGRTSEVMTVQDCVIESRFCKEQNMKEHSPIVDRLESSYSIIEPAFECDCIQPRTGINTFLGQRFSGSDLQSTSGLRQSFSRGTQYEACMISCPVCQNGSEPVRFQLDFQEAQTSYCAENLERRRCTEVSRTRIESDESGNDGNDCKRLSRSRRGTLRNKSRNMKFDPSKRYTIAAPEAIQPDRKTNNSRLGLRMSHHRSISCPTRSISCLPELAVWTDSNYNHADENSQSSTSENLSSRYSDCEFNILFRDIKLTECIGMGRRKAIYRGEWHGEVMVHLFDSLTREERIRFWQDVMRLTMTRHENIALFMGACAEPPNFAIVTSACNGISLYKKLHIQQEKIPRRFPFQVLRQVVHAMEYLHSRIKPIIIRNLTSRNIFLQPKVVLSLTDYASMECPYQTTLIFELHARRYPFQNLDNASFIAEVCAGRRDEGGNWYCARPVKNLMLSCWSPNPNHRPSVRQLTHDIIHKHIYYRRQHSDPTSTHLFSYGD